MLAFDNGWLPENQACYHTQLALATKATKDALEDFVTELPSHSSLDANYSRAFERAFELFSTASNSSESISRKKGKRTKFNPRHLESCCGEHSAKRYASISVLLTTTANDRQPTMASVCLSHAPGTKQWCVLVGAIPIQPLAAILNKLVPL